MSRDPVPDHWPCTGHEDDDQRQDDRPGCLESVGVGAIVGCVLMLAWMFSDPIGAAAAVSALVGDRP